jgi:hypothetical protein
MRPQDPRGTPGRAAAMPVVAGAVTVDARDRMSMEVHQNVKGPSPRGRPRAGANGVTASAEPQGATQSHATDGGLMSFLRQRIVWQEVYYREPFSPVGRQGLRSVMISDPCTLLCIVAFWIQPSPLG